MYNLHEKYKIMTTATHDWQLTFDFNLTLTQEKPQENKGSFSYHPSSSTILKDSFSLKVSYNWRSYILKWKYRISTIKAFWNNEDRLNMLWFVDLEKILAYRWLIYSPAFVTKSEKLKLTKVVEKVLANPLYNENLSN